MIMAPTALADVLPERIAAKQTIVPHDEPHVHQGEELTPMEAIAHGDVPLQGRCPSYPVDSIQPG